MAIRVEVFLTLVLSLLVLSQSQARLVSQKPEDLVFQKPENLPTQWNPSNDLPDSDAKTTISIPVDAIQPYTEEIPNGRVVEPEPKDLPEFNTIDDVRVMKPFTVSYDDSLPMNHQFHHFHHMPLKRHHHHHLFQFRLPIRCRHFPHHHRRHGNPMGPRFRFPRFTHPRYGQEIPFGTDMIKSDQAKRPRFTFDREIPYGNDMIMANSRTTTSEREIPYGNDMIMSDQANFDPMSNFNQDNNGFGEEDKMKRPHREDEDDHEDEKRPHREEEDDHEDEKRPPREDHEDKKRPHREEEDDHEDEKEDQEEEGGFMFLKNFRKVLNDFI